MMLAVRDGQTDLVNARGPRQPVALDVAELPVARDRSNNASAVPSTRSACAAIDGVALRQRIDAGRARIAMLGAADHVVEQALAHGRVADAHLLEIERGEAGFENRQRRRETR